MKSSLLITGASRGIGAETARLAAARGYRVCVNYSKDEVGAEAVVSAIRAAGGEAFACRADIAQEADVLQMFAQIDERFGGIDALVNNAGIVGKSAPLADMSFERMRHMFDINVLGAMLCAREAVRRMARSRGGSGGSIVNISSGAARSGSPNEYVDYAATKGAIDTFTVGLAKETAAEGIRVNTVRPGFIATDIHLQTGIPDRLERKRPLVPLGRVGQPIEIAYAILWLLSEEASFTTGATLDVAGGV